MSQILFYQWFQELRIRFSELKQWQAHGMAMISYGIIKARKAQASLIAEELPEFGTASAVERRLQRWMANPRIKMENVFASWVTWVLGEHKGKRLYLLVDETKISKRIACMMISLAVQKRAIPLVWRCYRANSAIDYPAEGQVKMIGKLLRKILVLVPENKEVVLQADRGIGNSSNLMREVAQSDAKFLFRVNKESIFTSQEGQATPVGELVTCGQTYHASGTLFTQKHREVQCNVHVIWETGQAEPWCLASNLDGLNGTEYALRVWQEESFRDLKSGGWQWQNSLIRNPEITERLLLPMAIAYAWCVSLGLLFPTLRQKIRSAVDCTRKHTKYCVFRMGLRFIKRYLFLNPSVIPIQIGPFYSSF